VVASSTTFIFGDFGLIFKIFKFEPLETGFIELKRRLDASVSRSGPLARRTDQRPVTRAAAPGPGRQGPKAATWASGSPLAAPLPLARPSPNVPGDTRSRAGPYVASTTHVAVLPSPWPPAGQAPLRSCLRVEALNLLLTLLAI
jgi:hypothetical protein